MSTPFLFFETLIGQAKAKDMLRKSIASRKISHAYLFKGPSGVGKRSTALAFSALANCQGKNALDACGQCPSCIKYLAGTHPDLQIIEPEGTAIKINQVRQLKNTLRFPPLEAQYRTVIITAVHLMRREAANSLLKTLEEPPENTILILTTEDSAEILPTITSRCQIIPFFPLPYHEVSRILSSEGLDPQSASTLAAVSEGSLGLAKILAEKNILVTRKEIVEKLVALSPGRDGEVETVFFLAEKASKFKENIEELLDLLGIWIRDLILQASGAPEHQFVSRDLLAAINTVKGRWTIEELTQKMKHIDAARRQHGRNCNRTLICEVLFFALL